MFSWSTSYSLHFQCYEHTQNHANSYFAFYMELFVSNNSEPINVILPGNQITTSTINIQVSLFMKEENKREDTLKKLDPNEAIEQ